MHVPDTAHRSDMHHTTLYFTPDYTPHRWLDYLVVRAVLRWDWLDEHLLLPHCHRFVLFVHAHRMLHLPPALPRTLPDATVATTTTCGCCCTVSTFCSTPPHACLFVALHCSHRYTSAPYVRYLGLPLFHTVIYVTVANCSTTVHHNHHCTHHACLPCLRAGRFLPTVGVPPFTPIPARVLRFPCRPCTVLCLPITASAVTPYPPRVQCLPRTLLCSSVPPCHSIFELPAEPYSTPFPITYNTFVGRFLPYACASPSPATFCIQPGFLVTPYPWVLVLLLYLCTHWTVRLDVLAFLLLCSTHTHLYLYLFFWDVPLPAHRTYLPYALYHT